MQNTQNKTKNMSAFLVRFEFRIFFLLGFVVLFLVFSYAFLIFSSVSIAFSIEEGEEQLTRINSENSILESEFSITKSEVLENFESKLVLSTNIEYIDSSLEKLVFGKK